MRIHRINENCKPLSFINLFSVERKVRKVNVNVSVHCAKRLIIHKLNTRNVQTKYTSTRISQRFYSNSLWRNVNDRIRLKNNGCKRPTYCELSE